MGEKTVTLTAERYGHLKALIDEQAKEIERLRGERDSYHDTLCAVTTLLLGTGCWTKEHLVDAINVLKASGPGGEPAGDPSP